MREVRDVWALREDLLGVNGIGCETADSILLYAFNKPVFVVDAYTRRIFSRHGFFREDSRYEDVQKFFMRNLPTDAKLFNEFHALIVKLGKDVCRKRPRCDVCPLAGIPRHTLGKVRTGGRAR
jgi:endonuclease-3 related protein